MSTQKDRIPRPNLLGTMSVEQVCSELGIAKRTLWDWCQQNKFPHRRLGGDKGRLIFDVKAVKEWLAAQPGKSARETIESSH